MREIKSGNPTLPDRLEQLAASCGAGDFNVTLDIEALPSEEQAVGRLINQILDSYRAAAEYGLTRMKNDEYRHFCAAGTTRGDPEGGPLRVAGAPENADGQEPIQEDIARRDAMMKAQAHWYRSILDATPLPITVTDTHMNWTFINKAVENFLGKKREDVLGTPCSAWGTDICATEDCGIARAKRGIPRTFFTYNDSSFKADVGILRDLTGEVSGFVEVVQDITEIKAMARRQAVLEENITKLEIKAGKIFYDPLTGIYNRRYFDENVPALIQMLSRSGSFLSVMMIDIDRFKQYNDTYGHVEGDNCLKTVTAVLKSNILRKGDFIVRYGGEEFVAVLPNTDETGARMLADRLLKDVRERCIPHENNGAAGCVTVSIGVVSHKAAYTQSGNDFIRKADEMMYKAKQEGRNLYAFSNL